MVNINKLKGKIVEKGLTIEKLAEKIGVDKSTLYRKIGNEGEAFTIKEANLICEILELNGKEATEIFFSQIVA
ncbi:helix-turn-helix domain-containing protein [Tissierella praeacuta]|uniref:helix-turn-helix domain-containing protein n=1 Tax=Tissierella praeacuta TaxID=43131 RepID=UPI00105203B6|nr:helix-turn-helix transcriptional regulator [Tissierella praeacuta]TCU72914.1 Cro/C1-type helix-turn-helix DNA-binding protein [Tissierella praeacuta]